MITITLLQKSSHGKQFDDSRKKIVNYPKRFLANVFIEILNLFIYCGKSTAPLQATVLFKMFWGN